MLHHFFFRFFLFAFHPLPLHVEANAAMVAPAQFNDVLAKTTQHTQLAAKFLGYFAIPARQRCGVASGQHGGQMIRQLAVGRCCQFTGTCNLGNSVNPAHVVP